MSRLKQINADFSSIVSYVPELLSEESLEELVEEAIDYAHVSLIHFYMRFI